MSRDKTIILEEVGCEDSQPFVVGRLGFAFEGNYKRKVLFIDAWCRTEDEARLLRDRANHP